MKSKIILLTIVLFITNVTHSFGQTKIDSEEIADKMQWFADAKLGIFIHTGIYAVNGITESWSFFNKRISHDDYMKQLNGFTMSKYDAAAWADLIKASGARYAVITTKHKLRAHRSSSHVFSCGISPNASGFPAYRLVL